MKFLSAVVVIAVCSGDVFAGPVRKMIENIRERRSQHCGSPVAAPMAMPNPALLATTTQFAPQYGQTFQMATGSCASGSCAPVQTGRFMAPFPRK